MSLFKKMLASVGIGSATVDTRLRQESLIPGQMVTGEVHITGGEVAQEIDEIYMYVITHYEREYQDRKVKEECTLLKTRLSEKVTLAPAEKVVLPFSFQLPYQTPLTMGRQPVYLRTGLDIKNALDPGDSDFMEVRPHPLMAKVLEAIQSIGFQLYKVDCEFNRYLGREFPFVQEFEFRPFGPLRSWIEELEVVFFLREDGLEVLLEVDKRARGLLGSLQEAFNLDERYVRFRLHAADQNRSTGEIASEIERLIKSQNR